MASLLHLVTFQNLVGLIGERTKLNIPKTMIWKLDFPNYCHNSGNAKIVG